MQRQANPSDAIERKYPEQVVLVTTRTLAGAANVMAVGWTGIASGDPLMFMLGIDEGAFTYKAINESREFVIAFPHEGMAKETLLAGSVSGRDHDKFAESGLKVQPAALVKAPLIAEAVANFECTLVQITTPGDCPLIIGRVVAAHVHTDSALRRLYTVGPGHKLSGVRPIVTNG